MKPRSLFARLMLILLCALAAAQALTFGLIWTERTMASRAMMLSYVAKDIATVVTLLENLPETRRQEAVSLFDRPRYRYALGNAAGGAAGGNALSQAVARDVAAQLGGEYRVEHGLLDNGQSRLLMRLKDGTPLSVTLNPGQMPLSRWLPAVLAVELALLTLAAWAAVRAATRPLTRLAKAAEALVPGAPGGFMPEDGPREVAQAARSFNAMQARIHHHLAERARMLAAISHDLQTPVTRMRLRAELLDDEAQRDKWLSDLEAMQTLIREGIDYARSAHPAETPQRFSIDALVAAIAADYQDAGFAVSTHGSAGPPLSSRPQAMKRILTNLIDNALKFGGEARIELSTTPSARLVEVLDAGPGIPESELEAVLQPFYRLEDSRNAETGGSGLGLAIAHQLAQTLPATLELSNRREGGLRARLVFNDSGA